MMIVTEYLPKVFCPTVTWNIISWALLGNFDVCLKFNSNVIENIPFLILSPCCAGRSS